MKNTILIALFVVIVAGLMGCSGAGLFHTTTFDEVSQPYLDKYGPPEETSKYDSGDYHSVKSWWWSKGFEVTFLDSPYDEVSGWKVDSTYSFAPIT